MNTYHYHRFEELLDVMDEEELVRFAYRLRKSRKNETAEILDDARKQREAVAHELSEGE